jgi:hypothetical protein
MEEARQQAARRRSMARKRAYRPQPTVPAAAAQGTHCVAEHREEQLTLLLGDDATK